MVVRGKGGSTHVIGELMFLITAYGLGCDAPGPFTKAGTKPVADFTIAADPTILPLGSIVLIEGYGPRMVHDIGPAVKGLHIDIFMSDCKKAKRIKQYRRVKILHKPRR